MDKEKAEAYEIIANMLYKGIVVIAVTLGWMVMVGFLIYKPSLPLGIGTAGAPFFMMKMIGQHYFPQQRLKKK